MKEIIVDYVALSNRANEIDIKKENALMREIILELKNTIREKNLVSLSAPQIGYDKRIFCINFNGTIKTFINPITTQVKGLELSTEVCSSIPGKKFIRPRHPDIIVVYQTPLGRMETRKLVGLTATVFQHELDHLEGILLSDIGLEIEEDFENATEEERNEILRMYLESLDIKEKEITKEIQNNKDLKQLSDAIDFITSVQEGKTIIEKVE